MNRHAGLTVLVLVGIFAGQSFVYATGETPSSGGSATTPSSSSSGTSGSGHTPTANTGANKKSNTGGKKKQPPECKSESKRKSKRQPSGAKNVAASTNAACRPKSGETYDTSLNYKDECTKGSGSQKKTYTDIYKKPCSWKEGKLTVNGQCMISGECKGLTYTDEKGNTRSLDEGSTPRDSSGGTTPQAKSGATTPKGDEAGSSALKAAYDPNLTADQKAPFGSADTKDKPLDRSLFDKTRIKDVGTLYPGDIPEGTQSKSVKTQTFIHNPEDSRFLVPSRIYSQVLRPEGRNSPAAITDIERIARQGTFDSTNNPSSQRQSASTFGNPESSPAAQPQGGIVQSIKDGADRVAGAIRDGFDSGARIVRASFYDTPGCGSFGLGPGGSCRGSRDYLRPGDVAVPVGSNYRPNQIIHATFCGPAGCRTYPMRVHDTCEGCAGHNVSIDVWGAFMRRRIEGDTGYSFTRRGLAPVTITFSR